MPSGATYNPKEIDQLRSELEFYKKEVWLQYNADIPWPSNRKMKWYSLWKQKQIMTFFFAVLKILNLTSQLPQYDIIRFEIGNRCQEKLLVLK